MLNLPVLLVLRECSAPRVLEALEREGVPCRSAAASEAADAVSAGWAELVVCERVPGWQALLLRIESAGGAAVLWGEPVRGEESKGMVPPEVEAVQAPSALRRALEQAQQRRQRRSALRSSDDLLGRLESAERISRYAQSIATQPTVPELVREAMARTRDLCDADGASLLLVDPATGELCLQQLPGSAPERRRLRPGEGIAGRVAQGATPLLLREVQDSPDFAGSPDEHPGFRTGSIIAVPLLLSGDVVGVLEAVRGRDRAPFEPGHLRWLEQLAPHVTIAVHNAQMTAHLREAQAQVLAANSRLEEKVRERTAQIAQGKREWERTFDAIDEPIALQDGFVLRRVNLAYARRVGLPIQQVAGSTCHALLAGRDSPCPGCPLLGASGQLSAELSFPADTVFALSGFWMEGAGPGRPVVVHYRDVTGEKHLERKLRESERLAALGQLASGAAHEINNPLGFVISNLRSLGGHLEELGSAASGLRAAAQARPEELSRALARVDLEEMRLQLREGLEMVSESLEGAMRVAEIVRGLRELSRLQVESTEPTSVDASVGRALRAELGESAHGVRLELQARGRARVSPLHLDQALGHVLRNARQAVRPGQQITVRSRDERGSVLLEVEDQGCGIAAEHLHRVFEPFFSTRGVRGGIGLGLTAAYGIVQRHGGSIELRSTPGRGTTVSIRLPRVELPEAQPAAAAALDA
ncbi:MAG TPA: ATP-binding protein [Aggregicoccus sp.]|nr:ATP-binding protein [Aggregicoccus sp.]